MARFNLKRRYTSSRYRKRTRFARLSGANGKVRKTMRNYGKVVPSSRNVARLPTRMMAKRAFLTRPNIFGTEFQYNEGAPWIQRVGAFVPGNADTSPANYRFREIGFGNVSDTTSGSNTLPCPLFNCYPSGTATWASDAPVRVLSGICRLTMRIEPFINNGWTDPNYYGMNPAFPYSLVVRIIGVRVYTDVAAGSDGQTYIPSYESGDSATYLSNANTNLLNCDDVWQSKGNEHWVTARVPDYTDDHTWDRKKDKRLVFDQKFMLRIPQRDPATATTSLQADRYQVNGALQHHINIRFPPHTIKGTSSGVGEATYRESHWRFYYCVYQPGTCASQTTIIKPIAAGAIGQLFVMFWAKSKFFWCYAPGA